MTRTDNLQLSFTDSPWDRLANYGYNSTKINGTQGWELRHKVDTNQRPDTGRINSSPTTSLINPVLVLPKNIKYTFKIPIADDDNDYLRCRWSSWMKSECNGNC